MTLQPLWHGQTLMPSDSNGPGIESATQLSVAIFHSNLSRPRPALEISGVALGDPATLGQRVWVQPTVHGWPRVAIRISPPIAVSGSWLSL